MMGHLWITEGEERGDGDGKCRKKDALESMRPIILATQIHHHTDVPPFSSAFRVSCPY